jgi:hypothetical protein
MLHYPKALFLVVIGLLMACQVASAQTTTSIGAGGESCGKWTSQRTDVSARSAREQWVFGYLSGVNRMSPDRQARPTDAEAISAYIDNYCSRNPLHNIGQASLALIDESGGPKAKHSWAR